jgi:hypothetical protein
VRVGSRVGAARNARWLLLVCAGCLSAPEGGGGTDGDAGADGGDGGVPSDLVAQLDLGAGTVRAARSRQSGDVFLAGSFSGDSPLPGVGSAGGEADLYVAQVSGEDGELLHAERHGGGGVEAPHAIAVDAATTHVVVVGTYDGEGAAGGETFAAPVGDSSNLFVAGYDDEGAHRWSHAGITTGLIQPGGVSIGAEGNALVCGGFDLKLELGANNVEAIVGPDIFHVPVSSSGTVETLVQHGTANVEACTDVVAEGAGPVYLIGFFRGGFSISGVPFEGDGASADGFVAVVNQAGDAATKGVVLGGSGDFGKAVGALRPDGGLVLFGWFEGELIVPGWPALEAESVDMVVASFDAVGTVEWAQRLGGPGADFPTSVSVTDDGRILLGGTFFESAQIGDFELEGQGAYDAFVAILDASGEVEWVRSFGGPLDDACTAAVAGGGHTIFAGIEFRDVIDFGGPEPLGTAGSERHAALLQLRP